MIGLLKAIREAWGWCGADPQELIAVNAFGNVIFRDVAGSIWRICPEELMIGIIAPSRLEYESLRMQPDFATDWDMEALNGEAKSLFGELDDGRCYCLKIPAVLGGQYAADNLGTISLSELLAASGNLALQIRGVPDGSAVHLVVKKSN